MLGLDLVRSKFQAESGYVDNILLNVKFIVLEIQKTKYQSDSSDLDVCPFRWDVFYNVIFCRCLEGHIDTWFIGLLVCSSWLTELRNSVVHLPNHNVRINKKWKKKMLVSWSDFLHRLFCALHFVCWLLLVSGRVVFVIWRCFILLLTPCYDLSWRFCEHHFEAKLSESWHGRTDSRR
jgi:hypothetical protein